MGRTAELVLSGLFLTDVDGLGDGGRLLVRMGGDRPGVLVLPPEGIAHDGHDDYRELTPTNIIRHRPRTMPR